MKRICRTCEKPIQRTHRWHTVRWYAINFLGLRLFKLEGVSHHNCLHPELGSQKTAGQRMIEPMLLHREQNETVFDSIGQ